MGMKGWGSSLPLLPALKSCVFSKANHDKHKVAWEERNYCDKALYTLPDSRRAHLRTTLNLNQDSSFARFKHQSNFFI